MLSQTCASTIFKKIGQSPPFFRLILSFPHDTVQILIDKSIGGVLGTQTWGGRMEGANPLSHGGTSSTMHSCDEAFLWRLDAYNKNLILLSTCQ